MKRTPNEAAELSRRVTRRVAVLLGLKGLAIGALALRMRDLQVREADRYRLLAEENRVNLRLIAPARGTIRDRMGRVLAENAPHYRVSVVREEAGDVAAILDRLAQLIPLGEADQERVMTEVRRRAAFVPVTVADRLTWDEVARISVNAPALPGVSAEIGLSRLYPLGPDFAHVVGYVGPVSERDLEREDDRDPLLQLPRFQVGKTGIENRIERRLRGVAGTRRIEINAVGRVMRELERQEPEPGADVQLTLDAALQNHAQQRLGTESASAVVMEVHSGAVLAVASAPSFDPNLFVEGISTADFRALLDNPYRPLSNKSVQGAYPPGSTFKMVVALAALEAGVINPEDTVNCPGHYEASGRRFHCWRRGGHGRVNLRRSISESCDVYYYDVAQRVGIDRIRIMAERLGLGMRHEVPLSAEVSGLMPDRNWKRQVRGQEWRIGDTINAGIGQGYVLSSPLQLAVMTARLATGRAVSPFLVRSVAGIDQSPPPAADLGIPAAHLAEIRRGMFEVSNDRSGTAYGARIGARDMIMAGKTGTSQVRIITTEERARGVIRNEDLPWERRDHALYVGYAPYEAPRYAVSVVVEHGGGGSAVAAPIARDLMIEALSGGRPEPEAWPAATRREAVRLRESLGLRSFPALPGGPERSRA